MATMETRTSPTGTAYRVKWRQDGTWQSETFGADRKRAALRFVGDVEHAANHWPEGWIKGVGYRRDLDEPAIPDAPLLAYAAQLVRDKTGLQPDTRQRYARQVHALAGELSEVVAADPQSDAGFASVQNLTDRHVARWINRSALSRRAQDPSGTPEDPGRQSGDRRAAIRDRTWASGWWRSRVRSVKTRPAPSSRGCRGNDVLFWDEIHPAAARDPRVRSGPLASMCCRRPGWVTKAASHCD